MCSIVCGDGLPLNNAIVTLSLPTATPFSNSNSLRNPKARWNHFALFSGSRTASPKWPTTPSVNGGFMGLDYETAQQTSNAQTPTSARGLLISVCMQVHELDPRKTTLPENTSEKPQRRSTEAVDSQYAIDEINAYIAIRDNLLAEAEATTTSANVRRLSLANDFVRSCLRSVQPP